MPGRPARLAMAQFEGFDDTPAELAMLRRGRAIRATRDWLNTTPFLATMADRRSPLLAAAKVPHQGVFPGTGAEETGGGNLRWKSVPTIVRVGVASLADPGILKFDRIPGDLGYGH